MIFRVVTMVAVFVGLSFRPALAQFDSGSDGSDGAFNPPQTSMQIDLSLAATANWDTPSPVPGQGVYDPERWAVVFKYAAVNMPQGAQITFRNHPSGAPVVWLVSGDVYIGGEIQLNGGGGAGSSFSVPGPGGFGGGRGGPSNTPPDVAPSAAFGPGGGGGGGGGTYASGNNPSLRYGNQAILPLIGGSGGGGVSGAGNSLGGGAGGGAILIAASGDIVIDGQIIAAGGTGGQVQNYAYAGSGSGGAIRLLANNVSGSGLLRANGGVLQQAGGSGRIRVEAASSVDLADPGDPLWTSSVPGPIFPLAGAPTLRVVSVNAVAIPADPSAGILTTDAEIATDEAVTVNIEARNIPIGTTIDVRIVPEHGFGVTTIPSTPLADAGGGLLVATATATLPTGRSEIQLRANWVP